MIQDTKLLKILSMLYSVFLAVFVIFSSDVFAQQVVSHTQPIKGKGVSALTSSGGFRTTAFYAEFDNAAPTPAQIDWSALTHIIIFGTAINTSTAPYLREAGNVSPSDSANFDGGYNRSAQYANWLINTVDSAHAHGIKVYFSLNVGTVFGIPITALTNNVANRHVFEHYVAGAGGWMARRHLDGIYWDYEYPNNPDTGWKSTCAELRDTMATWTTPLMGVDVPNYWEPVFGDTVWTDSTFSQIDIMEYGMSDGNSTIGFNSPLFQPYANYPNYQGTSWFGDTYNQQGLYIGWVNHGIKKSLMGVVFLLKWKAPVGALPVKREQPE